MITDPLYDTKCILVKWANWRKNDYSALGYPRQSAEQVIPIQSSRSVLPEWDIEMNVESIVNSMDKDFKRVLMAAYIWHGTAETKCKGLRISRDMYFDRLRCATWWVKGRLNT